MRADCLASATASGGKWKIYFQGQGVQASVFDEIPWYTGFIAVNPQSCFSDRIGEPAGTTIVRNRCKPES